MSLLLCGARGLRAQAASELLGQGVRAYQSLEYDAAAALLQQSLGRDATTGLADSLRARALTYLAATELFRQQRDSAVAAFRQLVMLNPRYRPDERSEEHTSELQSLTNLVCRLLLEKKKK